MNTRERWGDNGFLTHYRDSTPVLVCDKMLPTSKAVIENVGIQVLIVRWIVGLCLFGCSEPERPKLPSARRKMLSQQLMPEPLRGLFRKLFEVLLCISYTYRGRQSHCDHLLSRKPHLQCFGRAQILLDQPHLARWGQTCLHIAQCCFISTRSWLLFCAAKLRSTTYRTVGTTVQDLRPASCPWVLLYRKCVKLSCYRFFRGYIVALLLSDILRQHFEHFGKILSCRWRDWSQSRKLSEAKLVFLVACHWKGPEGWQWATSRVWFCVLRCASFCSGREPNPKEFIFF